MQTKGEKTSKRYKKAERGGSRKPASHRGEECPRKGLRPPKKKEIIAPVNQANTGLSVRERAVIGPLSEYEKRRERCSQRTY